MLQMTALMYNIMSMCSLFFLKDQIIPKGGIDEEIMLTSPRTEFHLESFIWGGSGHGTSCPVPPLTCEPLGLILWFLGEVT